MHFTRLIIYAALLIVEGTFCFVNKELSTMRLLTSRVERSSLFMNNQIYRKVIQNSRKYIPSAVENRIVSSNSSINEIDRYFEPSKQEIDYILQSKSKGYAGNILYISIVV